MAERITSEEKLFHFFLFLCVYLLSFETMSAFAAQFRARVASVPSKAAVSKCSAAAVVPRAATTAAAATSRLAASSISTTPSTTTSSSSSLSSSLPSYALQSRRRRVPAAPQAAPWAEGIEPPTSAETARTIVDITAHGTLCSSGSDGVPLGAFFFFGCCFLYLNQRAAFPARFPTWSVSTNHVRISATS